MLGQGLVPPDTPVLLGDDLGMTRGDGCFDATLVRVVAPDGPSGHASAAGASREHSARRTASNGNGVPVALHLEAHLARFARSAATLGLPALALDAWRALVDTLLQAWPTAGGRDGGDGALKLVVTRGREYVADAGPTAYGILVPHVEPVEAQRDGITLATLSRGVASNAFTDAPWLLGGVKTLSYAVNVAARREAAARGADDALFVSTDGYALEGPTSAIIWADGDVLTTTPVAGTGILASVTQQAIFDAAPTEGLRTAYRLGTIEELCAADGAWVASAVRGPLPVRSIDGRALPVDAEATARIARMSGYAVP